MKKIYFLILTISLIFPLQSQIPIMNVFNGQSIPDGQNTVTPATFMGEFTFSVTNPFIEKTFYINNNGNVPLILGNVTVGGMGFSIVQQPVPIVAPFQVTSVKVRYTPQGVNNMATTHITIPNNDPVRNPYNFKVGARPEASYIKVLGNGKSIQNGDVTPNSADHTLFPQTLIGEISYRTFFISNAHIYSTNGSIISAPLLLETPVGFVENTPGPEFSIVSQPNSSVNFFSTEEVTVRFAPVSTTPKTVTLRINSDDINDSPFEFTIRGQGFAP